MRDQVKQEADTNLRLMRYIKLVNLGDGRGWRVGGVEGGWVGLGHLSYKL